MKKIFLLSLLCAGICLIANAQEPADSSAQQYLGKYKFPDGSVILEANVSIENGALTMTSSAGTSPLVKKADDLYTIVNFQGTAKFNRDANKKITGVSILAMGYELEGTRTDAEALAGMLQKIYFRRSVSLMIP